jgi:hypothetical protein
MPNQAAQSESHEHPSPQCKATPPGSVCREDACRHDHHVSRHFEVSCTPVEGQRGMYRCVHSASHQ